MEGIGSREEGLTAYINSKNIEINKSITWINERNTGYAFLRMNKQRFEEEDS